jgi:hypothetical protein
MQALAEELARRLGRDRCWRVRWPIASLSNQETGAARKDANEVLMKDGSAALEALIRAAEPYPIRGLFKCVLVLPCSCAGLAVQARLTLCVLAGSLSS